MAIDAIGTLTSIVPGTAAAAPAAGASNFGDTLAQLMQTVNASDAGANAAVADMVSGSGDVHEAMIALQQADLTLQLSIQIRNKLVSAYQEISRMPV